MISLTSFPVNRALLAVPALLLTATPLALGGETKPFTEVPSDLVEQAGTIPEGLTEPHGKVLSNEPGAAATLTLNFDLKAVAQATTPLARLQLGELAKLPVKRPGHKNNPGRGALHVRVQPSGKLAGSAAVKPAGIPTVYTIDVTAAINEALSRPAGDRKLRLRVLMTGKPNSYEVYHLLAGPDKKPPTLEIASPANWTNDWEQRLTPIGRGPLIYREACMPIAENTGTELTLPLLYPATRIAEVIHSGTGGKLEEGRDWILRDGKLVLPPGSQAPIQVSAEFFSTERKDKEGNVTRSPASVRLVEGLWYHERQIEVTYEPTSRDWQLPAAVSTLDNLPRLKKLLAEKKPITVVLFGDSISLGGNASKFQGGWPYQPAFGEFVAWELARRGSKIIFMNHSRGGAGSAFGSSQAASQAGWFKPDLVIVGYGMNDRGEKRRPTYRQDLEKIIDAIRQESPDTEILLVTSMLNNPKQPTGLEPVLALRDEALKISRPGLAFVDMTGTHQELIKHKNYLDTSGNGANHPNDFLQRIYAQRILEVLTPP